MIYVLPGNSDRDLKEKVRVYPKKVVNNITHRRGSNMSRPLIFIASEENV
jgi:hypothetical protein